MKKKQAQSNDQGMLFTESECDELQEILKNNYREQFEKARYVPEAEEESEDLIELPTTHQVLQQSVFADSEIEDCQQISDKMNADNLQNAILEARKNIIPPRYAHPKNDNEWLFNFQYDFIVNGSQEAYGHLLELSFTVTKRLIRRWLAKMGGKVFWDEITQDEKTMEAIVYVLRRYSTTVGWYCSTNFITVLNDGVRHVTKYQTKIEKQTFYCEDVNVAVSQDKKTKLGKKNIM